jgi:hypothetical protein
VTRREVEASAVHVDSYHLYRVFGFRTRPQLFVLDGPIRDRCVLDAAVWSAQAR